MKTYVATNGAVTLVIAPENEMEVQMLKQLANQPNDIRFTDNGIQIVNTSVSQGLVISKETKAIHAIDSPDNNSDQEQDTSESDEDKEEDL